MARKTRGKRVRAVFDYDSDGDLVEDFGNVDEALVGSALDSFGEDTEPDVSDED